MHTARSAHVSALPAASPCSRACCSSHFASTGWAELGDDGGDNSDPSNDAGGDSSSSTRNSAARANRSEHPHPPSAAGKCSRSSSPRTCSKRSWRQQSLQGILLQQMSALLAAHRPSSPPPVLIAPESPRPARPAPAAAVSPVRPPVSPRSPRAPAPRWPLRRTRSLKTRSAGPRRTAMTTTRTLHTSAHHHTRARVHCSANTSPTRWFPRRVGSGHHNPQLLAEALSRATRKTAKYCDLTLGTVALAVHQHQLDLPLTSSPSVVHFHQINLSLSSRCTSSCRC